MQWPGVHDLVLRAKTGDPQAWGQLEALVQPYLLRLAGYVLGPGWPNHSVSDLIQETRVRAWQNLGQFIGGKDDDQTAALLRAWLARILRNLHRNDRRFAAAQRRRPQRGTVSVDAGLTDDSADGHCGCEVAAEGSTPSANLRREEERDLVHQALAQLDPADRQIVHLKFFAGRSFRQIGEQLRLDESTVRYRFQRILGRLGRELKGLQ
jgi:RNA polymerase sigma factor (sigma-70 family)